MLNVENVVIKDGFFTNNAVWFNAKTPIESKTYGYYLSQGGSIYFGIDKGTARNKRRL